MADWIKTAKVGDKVELVADLSAYTKKAASDGITLPSKGKVYTIREMEDGTFFKPWIYLRFKELVNGPCADGVEASFFSGWFRPVVTPITSIAVFEKLLQSAPADQPMEDA